MASEPLLLRVHFCFGVRLGRLLEAITAPNAVKSRTQRRQNDAGRAVDLEDLIFDSESRLPSAPKWGCLHPSDIQAWSDMSRLKYT